MQNIDLMNLAGFCRDCLSKWLKETADASSVELTNYEAKTYVYGMNYGEWKLKYQK